MAYRNVFSWWKVWTAGRSAQHLNSSTMRPQCYNRYSFCFSIVFFKCESPSPKNMWSRQEQMSLSNMFLPFSTDGAFTDVQRASSIGTQKYPHTIRCRLLNWALITSCMIPLLFSPETAVSMISNKNVKFQIVWPQNSFPLCFSPFQMSFDFEKMPAFLNHVHMWLILCMLGL